MKRRKAVADIQKQAIESLEQMAEVADEYVALARQNKLAKPE